MGGWLDRIIVLCGLAALAACIEMAPRSSVPFHDARDRYARYAAEVTLAINEQRRDEVSEATVNARIVRPQMPEIWGITATEMRDLAPAEPPLALLDPDHGGAPLQDALQMAGLLLNPSIAPEAAPFGVDPATAAWPYRFDLYFDLNSAAIDAAAERVLKAAVGSALMVRPVRIIVAGHTDRSGAVAVNLRLARRRAAAVASALIRAGVPADLIEIAPPSEGAPAIGSEDGITHRHQRRVEITLV